MHVVIGLTGNIACGKSVIGDLLRKRGIEVIDSDAIVHEIYENDQKVREAVSKEFGTLDRKEIAKQVFGDSKIAKQRRKILEEIVHPAVDLRLREWVRHNKDKEILVNLVPLVFEAELESRYNYIITVVASEELQIERLKKRNPNLTQEEILQRIRSQMPQALKAEKSDFVIENSGSIEDLEEQVEDVLSKIREKNILY